jgi:hypothetical protein
MVSVRNPTSLRLTQIMLSEVSAQRGLCFEVFTAVIVKVLVSLVVTPCRFLGRTVTFRRNLLEEIYSSETSLPVHKIIRYHKPKDDKKASCLSETSVSVHEMYGITNQKTTRRRHVSAYKTT